jgi:hypothetical protein
MDQKAEEISIDGIRQLLPKLSRAQIMELDREIHEYLETSVMMRAAQTAFAEWEDPEEGIYDSEV